MNSPTDDLPSASDGTTDDRAGAGALSGRTVLVTAQRKAAELGALLERHGATVVNAPALSVIAHAEDEQLLAATRELIADPPQIVVVTTGIGFRGWLEAADAAGIGGALRTVLAGARLAVRGPKALGAVRAVGLTAAWVAQSETAAELIEVLRGVGVAGQRIAVQHHGAGSDGLDEALTDAGGEVVPLVVYRWGPPEDPEGLRRGVRAVADGTVDCVVFTAAPGAAAFLAVADELGLRDRVVASCATGSPVLAAAVGTTTAVPLTEAGITPLVPERFRLGALGRAIVTELSRR